MDTEKAAHLLVKWRWLFVLLTVGLVLTAGSGARFVGFATDYEYWFSADNPELKAFQKLQNTYNKSDNVIFLLAPEDGNVFTRETLASVEWLTEQSWQMPYSTRVDSLTNFQYTYAEDDDLVVADLAQDSHSLSNNALTKIKQIAMAEPLLLNRAVSNDGTVAAINVTINLPKNTPEGSPVVTAFARDLLKQLNQQNPSLETHLTGLVVMDNAFMEASMKDMGSLTLLMFGLVLAGLVILLRSVTGTISTLVIIMMAIISTMGISGWMGVLLTPVSANAPIIILTVTVAHAVHILVSFIHAMRTGETKRAAMIESLRINLQPVFLATLTTAIGFLSMNFSEVPPFRDLGNMVAIGVIFAFMLSITLLPSLILLLPVRVPVVKDYQNRHMDKLSDFVIRYRNAVLWSTVIFSLLSISFITSNEITTEPPKFFDHSVQFRIDTDFASERLVGPYYMEYSLDSNKTGGVSNPAFLQNVDQFKDWLMQQPEVVHVNAITDIMKRLNKNMHGDDPAWLQLPDRQDLAAQYLLLYEMSLPYGLDLNNQLNVDKSATRMVASMHNMSSPKMLVFQNRVELWLAENMAEVKVIAGSPMYMFSNIAQRTVVNMSRGVSFALILISLVLIVSFRSFRTGAISLVPNLLPPAVAFGIWGLLVGEIGFSHAVAFGMTIGIIVDDTVHFLSKYLRARREKGLNPEEAVRYAFSSVGVALVITTIVLVIGFMVLASSTFKLNSDLGLITALTITIALLLDFLLLPALLMVIDKKQERPQIAKIELATETNA
ncbi:MAG: putative RND superfamily exporter protein [Gammaproteobacteria bacterium]|jgi:predicted RND superfamily exporter protein